MPRFVRAVTRAPRAAEFENRWFVAFTPRQLSVDRPSQTLPVDESRLGEILQPGFRFAFRAGMLQAVSIETPDDRSSTIDRVAIDVRCGVTLRLSLPNLPRALTCRA